MSNLTERGKEYIPTTVFVPFERTILMFSENDGSTVVIEQQHKDNTGEWVAMWRKTLYGFDAKRGDTICIDGVEGQIPVTINRPE